MTTSSNTKRAASVLVTGLALAGISGATSANVG
jgi:hypothetical protein